MRPAVATTAGSRWEEDLANVARTTGLVRLLGRCTDVESVRALIDRIDVLFVDSETPWLGDLAAGLPASVAVIGVAADAPGTRRLRDAGVTEVVGEITPPDRLLHLAVALAPTRGSTIVGVTGPRGAPGRSEVSLALATAWSRQVPTALIERDADAPSVGLRLGLAPTVETHAIPGGPTVVPAQLGQSSAVRDALAARVVAAHRLTVMDLGPWAPGMWTGDVPVLVGEVSPVGVVRLARICSAWDGPVPMLVVNRSADQADLRTIRAATGLEPSAVVPRVQIPSGRTASEIVEAVSTICVPDLADPRLAG